MLYVVQLHTSFFCSILIFQFTEDQVFTAFVCSLLYKIIRRCTWLLRVWCHCCVRVLTHLHMCLCVFACLLVYFTCSGFWPSVSAVVCSSSSQQVCKGFGKQNNNVGQGCRSCWHAGSLNGPHFALCGSMRQCSLFASNCATSWPQCNERESWQPGSGCSNTSLKSWSLRGQIQIGTHSPASLWNKALQHPAC